MNERIKELMLEAGYAAPELAGRGQKFAELVVRECAGIAETAEPYQSSDLIKQHFGITE
jgi:hypothetical protein